MSSNGEPEEILSYYVSFGNGDDVPAQAVQKLPHPVPRGIMLSKSDTIPLSKDPPSGFIHVKPAPSSLTRITTTFACFTPTGLRNVATRPAGWCIRHPSV